MTEDHLYQIKKKLFHHAMKGEWDAVVTTYKIKSSSHKAKITRSGLTALHMAVSDRKEDIVEQLVETISSTRIITDANWTRAVLQLGDERGNTPLHIAAATGSVRMCRCIAKKDPSLIGIRNDYGETPLFLAARNGHKYVFLCLHSLCPAGNESIDYIYCRRSDGETILHRAISGEYFDLAFQIIHRYEGLVNSVNQQGLTPLHILATKPAAFRSGSHIGFYAQFLYNCISVDKLEVETWPEQSPLKRDNWGTWVNMIKKVIKVASNRGSTGKGGEEQPRDAENPEGSQVLTTTAGEKGEQSSGVGEAEDHQPDPPKYKSCLEFTKLVSKAMLVVLAFFGSTHIRKIEEEKQKHTWSVQVMNELLKDAKMNEHLKEGKKPLSEQSLLLEEIELTNYFPESISEESYAGGNVEGSTERKKEETVILIAAKNGITEIVERTLELFPEAADDTNSDNKNIVLLAVENRQPHLYQVLLERTIMQESLFRKVDNEGNGALHLAASIGDHKSWLIGGPALQMQWEIKWYEFVKTSVPPYYFARYNNKDKLAQVVFTETHEKLVEAGGNWLNKTSESCSVVAALIATVAFATSATVPGGMNDESGKPTLENQPAFNVFAISSLVALCFSVIAVVLFLSLLTSRYQERDFGKDLPRKLLLGLTSLFVSIASMLISFCAGHYFFLKDKLNLAALPVYAVACLTVTYFAIAHFPLYFDVIWATYKKVPQRSSKFTSL